MPGFSRYGHIHVYVTRSGKPSVKDPCVIRTMHIFSSSDQNLSKSRFVVSKSNNPSSNCSRRLWRLVVRYKGKISLHFNPPSLYCCRTRSPLLREFLRAGYLDTARFIELLYVRSPSKLFGHWRTSCCCCLWRNSTLARSLRSFWMALPRSIWFPVHT